MSDEIAEIFGQVLQQTRKQLSMSQEELAYASSLNRTYISHLENGKQAPSLVTLFNLAQALNEKPSTLLRRVELHLSQQSSKQKAV
ncbi:helix-turn-helix domain-containing protein [Hymenobacter fodinae]|jgi:transcriptional regulator with XRE-family HTH domain|uniref:XRE family transcriptional regulator n=1 Tax=Hymenobacter fodinae TaxID=2510796 RepID=A0A4Z0NZP8_9BACT|nr:helix-turn-helix transcriptional regulator [Hymenobacter fodinae]TGE03549.1 XRE family transcriptional regulator [Hymenobacter fodinae]